MRGAVALPALLFFACASAGQEPPTPALPTCNATVQKKTEECIFPPKLKKDVDPEYPKDATTADPDPSAVLSALIDEKGRPQDIRVARSLGERFDEAAVKAVKQWRFEPARTNTGRKLPVRLNLEVRFIGPATQLNALYVCGDKHPPPCAKYPPKVIHAPDPQYSAEARKESYQGMVILLIVVDEYGRVARVSVQRAAGRGLDEEAARAVKRWRFKPARLEDNTPVAVQINVEMNFRLY